MSELDICPCGHGGINHDEDGCGLCDCRNDRICRIDGCNDEIFEKPTNLCFNPFNDYEADNLEEQNTIGVDSKE